MGFKYKKGLTSDTEILSAIEEILCNMTLEEKSGQLCQSVGSDIVAIGSTKVKENVDDLIRNGKIGSMIQVDEPLAMANRISRFQELAVNESRLGIPLIFAQDVIHGFETIFPIPLAWAASFNMEKIENAAMISGLEAGSCGIMMAFSPMVDIARDPRWGRVSEGAGEDPYLGEEIAKAQVRGFNKAGMLCCLKHFVGYGAAEAGRDYNTTEITDTTLNNVYFRPFKAGIEEGAGSVMASFNCINGIPVTANKHILSDILRDRFKFNGIVISDYSAVMELIMHSVAADEREAAIKAFNATLDIEMTTNYYRRFLPEAILSGVISETDLDNHVSRVLYAKYKLGIMDDPFKYIKRDRIESFVFSKENRKASYDLAVESAVLLENNGILPLKKDKRIALIGPFAKSKDLLGCWQFSHKREETISIYEGLIEEGYDVIASEGTDIFEEKDIDQAIEVARNSDVVVMALGESSVISGEACSRQNTTIPDIQIQLLEKVKEIGKPIILLVVSGRPLILSGLQDKVDAIMEVFFLGSDAGSAISALISGKQNPSGHLPMSFPYSSGQIPVYYNQLPTGRPYDPESNEHFLSRYLDGPNEPLYSFGYGLSYSSFDIQSFEVSFNEAEREIRISAFIENTSDIVGRSLVQVYIRDKVATISRPLKELKAFKKIEIKPHGKVSVSFSLKEKDLGFYMPDGNFVVEPGEFDIYLGFSSRNKDLIKKTIWYGASND